MKAVGNRNTMAATLSLTQLSSGNPIYEKYYRQADPTGSGRVAAADAALFLKRSGLADLVLGKIWDLADSERKGSLNKQQFFIALRLVACAQNGVDVALKSLNVAVPPPKFHDTSSPLLAGGVAVDIPWVVKPEEKMKFDSIFDSLGPVGGILTGDKVKPVLLNSKLPVDILGRVWELSDLDRDGMLDRDEFSVAMYLVYRALEGEPVPMSLPPPLVPPSKRKKPSVPPVMPLLPSPPSVKDSRSSHAASKTLPHPPKPSPAPVPTPAAAPWVVLSADKAKYDELFSKTDSDMDGLVSGPEVRDIFLKTGLPSATLARIWELCDIGDIGKLTREQFALALHLINQKLTKGLDPPQSLSPEMIPPSDRQNIKQNNVVNLAADFSAIKELDSLSNEIVELQREKSSVEEEIKEKEEAIRQRSNEVQDLQDEVARENEELQRLQAQRQKVQEALEELDQQKGSLEEQLTHIRQQTSQETQLISSLQSEHEEQEQRICQYEEELVQAREELLALQEESRRLQEKVQAAQEQLTPLQESVRDSFTQVAQVQQKLNDLQVEERSVTAQLSWKRALEDSSPVMVNGSAGLSAELYQADPFQQDLFQDDQPKELKEEEPAAVCNQQKEHSDQKEKGVNEREEEEEKEDESPKTPEEEKMKPDPLDDLYTSLASSEMYNNVSSLAKPQENSVREQRSPTPDISSEVTDEAEESPKVSPPKVASPEPESKEEPAESPETTTTTSLPPQVGPRSMPPQTSPPSLPEMDFFHSDPFTDHDPFKDDPFGKADVADPFGGDPFKGSDPFAADSFFAQTSSIPFSSDDPFSASADPFGTTTGMPEPDLFAAKLNDAPTAPPTAPPPAAATDPFTSKPTNPALAAKDPFTSTGNNMADSDPFGGKMNAAGEADLNAKCTTTGTTSFTKMSLGTFQRPARQTATTSLAATPPRLRPKGPVGPDFYRQCPTAAGRPKQSAVERLEADKAKYVKSQVALSKQQPVRPPDMRKPLLNPSSALRPNRKTQTPMKPKKEGVQLNLEHLTNLISGVNDGPQPSTPVKSEDSKVPSPRPTPAEAQQKKERPCPPPRPDWSSPAKVRLKASGPTSIESSGSPGSPAAGTVRRVDVIPQASPVRTCRPPQYMRQPLQPLHSQFPLRPTASHLRLFHTRTTTGPSPVKPVAAPSKPEDPLSPPAGTSTPASALPPPNLPVFPPSSPAITRLSTSSSRKRPSLTRSKSDMSDRCSRAGTEMERFFNLCGLDPADLQEWTGSSSDIVSMARFRSVSAPGSECAGSQGQGEDAEEEEAGNAAERVPYGVSVIERNARVIKWLYGLRNAKDNTSKSTNL